MSNNEQPLASAQDPQLLALQLAACQAELDFYRDAQIAAHIGTWHWDIGQDIVRWSDNVEALLGLTPHSFAGTFAAYLALIPNDEKDFVQAQIEDCLAGKQTSYRVEHHVICPDGQTRWLEASGNAHRDAQQRPISMTGSVINITERKQLNQYLVQLANSTSTVIGQAFLDTFVVELAKVVSADHVFIATINTSVQHISTISVGNQQGLLKNFSYSMLNTPCDNALHQQTCLYADNVQAQFPDDIMLQSMGIHAYIGAPLLNHKQQVAGLLVLLFKQPLRHTEFYQSIIDLFKPRIIAELDRLDSSLHLEMSEKRYRQLIQHTSQAIVIFDIHSGKFVEANSAAEHLFKMPRIKLLEVGPVDVSPAQQENGDNSALAAAERIQAALNGDYTPFDWQHLDSNNTIIHCDVCLQHVIDKDRTLVRATIVHVGDSKAAVENVLESEENLRITLNSIADAVIATDINLHITRINPVAERLLGYTAADCLGKSLHDTLHLQDEYQHKAISLTELLANNGKELTQTNYRLINAHRHEACVSCKASPIKTLGKHEIGAVFVLRDITQQQETENRLRQAQKMESIGQLAGGIAHDFNNMLAGILATSELLGLHIKDEKLQSYIKTITNTSLNAASLTQQLLSFSRKGKIESKHIHVHDLIKNVLLLLHRSIDKRISIETDLAAQDAYITGDQRQLESALLNLGINARDAMPQGGQLCISTSNAQLSQADCAASSFEIKPGYFLKLSVTDTGTGIDAAILAHIFEPFFTTKGVGEGTGLGLAAVYGTVYDHHGMIAVETTAHVGTCFSIYLPAAATAEPAPVSHLHLPVIGSGSILMIDDEQTILDITASLLESVGYQVTSALRATAGLALLTEQPDRFDIIILDMMMPDMNGTEVYHKIKAINPQLHVLIASGYAHDQAINDLLAAGADAFLQKPFRFHELSKVLSNIREH